MRQMFKPAFDVFVQTVPPDMQVKPVNNSQDAKERKTSGNQVE